MYIRQMAISLCRSLSLLAEANFYEKALFVKPTWRPYVCGGCDCSLPFALCFYPHCR